MQKMLLNPNPFNGGFARGPRGHHAALMHMNFCLVASRVIPLSG